MDRRKNWDISLETKFLADGNVTMKTKLEAPKPKIVEKEFFSVDHEQQISLL
jgi:hypothetical protein